MTQSAEATKVLLVEDNELSRDMLSRRLMRRGFHVETVADGETAVKSAALNLPDVILMDMALPGLSGWDATRTIKANPETKHIPVVALTAHALKLDRDQAVAAGCDAFETKPIEFERLLTTIRQLAGVTRRDLQ